RLARQLVLQPHRRRVSQSQGEAVGSEALTEAEQGRTQRSTRGQLRFDAGDPFVEPRPQDVCLRVEVVEEARPCHTRPHSDLGDRGALVPLLEEQLARRLRDRLARRCLRPAGAHRTSVSSVYCWTQSTYSSRVRELPCST